MSNFNDFSVGDTVSCINRILDTGEVKEIWPAEHFDAAPEFFADVRWSSDNTVTRHNFEHLKKVRVGTRGVETQ